MNVITINPMKGPNPQADAARALAMGSLHHEVSALYVTELERVLESMPTAGPEDIAVVAQLVTALALAVASMATLSASENAKAFAAIEGEPSPVEQREMAEVIINAVFDNI